MKKKEIILKVIKYVLLLTGLICGVMMYFFYKDIRLMLTAIVLSLIYFAVLTLSDKLHESYLNEMLIKLSDLIESLTSIKEYEVFSDVEDSLVSKLQNQVVKLRDILKNQNEMITEEKEDIKSLISDISHQIKTPVATVKMYSELVEESDITPEERREYIGIMHQSLDKLLFLTESIVKMSRLETGIIQIKKQNTTVNSVLLPAIRQVVLKAQKKGIIVNYDTPDDYSINVDEKWTGEALFNVIDNAVKYSDDNSNIDIDTFEYESYVKVVIKDYGKGLKEMEIPLIFKRFYRGENALDKEGVGIGLYLTRSIIVSQGGYIRAKSDNGMEFQIFLPVK